MMANRLACWVVTVVAGLLVTIPTVTAQNANRAAVMLEAAIQAQLVDGDLEAAIELYTQILDRFGHQRPVAANALLHLGECYELLGRQEARAAYERLLTEFADQGEVADKARARLTALGPTETSTGERNLTIRKAWSGSVLDPRAEFQPAISPDGRSLSYANMDDSFDLAILDLASGEHRDVTTAGNWWNCSQYPYESVWSPDGDWLAYHWFNCDDPRPHHSLRIIRTDGSERRVLLRTEEIDWPQPVAWAPDGTQIVALLGKTDRTWQIALVSVADGSVQALKTLDWRRPELLSLSPDGRYLVYDLPPTPTAAKRDLFILAIDGSRGGPLVQHPGNDSLPVWSPGGDAVVFVSDRTGTPGLWRVDVAGGRPVDEPRLIKAGADVWPFGFAADGAFYYRVSTDGSNIWTVDFDPATATIAGEPIAATTRGSNVLSDWSPDGRHLAYLSLAGGRASPGHQRATLVIRDVDSGVDRTLFPSFEFRSRVRIRWSPDGRSLLAIGRDGQGRPGLHAIDVGDGSVTPLVIDAEIGHQAKWSADGGSVLFLRGDWIMLRDLSTEQERRLAASDRVGKFAPSPDGRMLAYARSFAANNGRWRRELMVVPMSGGEPRSLTGLMEIYGSRWNAPQFIEWSPDGRHVLFGVVVSDVDETGQERSELWKVPVEGGEPELLSVPTRSVCHLTIAPSGRQLAFNDCSDPQRLPEIWVIENLLQDSAGRN